MTPAFAGRDARTLQTPRFTYDPVSRLASLTNALTDANDLSVTFAYNPASQIASNVRTGDMYAWTGHGNGSTAFVQNGLNQQTSIGGVTATWDTKGNLTSEPQSGKTYTYSSENLLKTASGGVTLAYDPALRLYQTVSGAATTRFLYDGVDAIAEYDGANALLRRFVFDPTTGQPVLWYEGNGTLATNRRYLSLDERGSVISVSDSTGASLGLNTYDEYGKPGSGNLGRYQYTGQKWIGEAGLYDYKARDYLPHLGIFAQTDPIGQIDSPNLYAYVLNDPVNLVDPLGLDKALTPASMRDCTGTRLCAWQGDRGNPQQLPGGWYRGGAGYWKCTNCGQLAPGGSGPNDPVIITAPQWVWIELPTGEAPFYFNGERFVVDPLYRKPWYSNYFDACFVVCPAAAGAALAYGGPVVATRLATTRTFGVASSRFGNPYYAGVRGTWNQGTIRLGWSYWNETDMMYFQMRIGNWHVPTTLVTPPPF